MTRDRRPSRRPATASFLLAAAALAVPLAVPGGPQRSFATTVLNGATLDHDLIDNEVVVRNGLTLLNGASVTTTGVSGGADLRFYGTQAVSGNGTIYLNNEQLFISQEGASNTPPVQLTIGPGVTVTTPVRADKPGGSIESLYGYTATLVNNGTIWGNGGGIRIGYFDWTNNATLRASNGGSIFLTGSLVNSSTEVIEAIDGGTVAVIEDFVTWPTVTNHGLIRVRNGTLRLVGWYTIEDIGPHEFYNATWQGVPGADFTFDNTGRVLDMDATTGTLTLSGQVNVVGGTVRTRDGADVVLTPETPNVTSYHTFEDVTLDGVVRSSAPYDHFRVGGDLTMVAGARVSLVAALDFRDGTGSLLGDGEVAAGTITGTHVTVGPGVTVKSGAAAFTFSGDVTNDGTLLFDRPSGTYTLAGPAWRNEGTIRVTAGALKFTTAATSYSNSGTISAEAAGASATFAGANTGVLRAAGGGSLTIRGPNFVNAGAVEGRNGGIVNLSGPFSGPGTISLDGATLNIATPLTLAQLSAITGTSATYVVAGNGAVDLQGGTLAHSPGIAWQLANGKFANGTIATPLTSTGTIGTLDNVTLAADSAITTGTVTVLNSLGLSGGATLSLGGAAQLSFSGSQSITGNGQIAFNGTSGAVRPLGATGTTLTIGPLITVKTGSGSGTVGFSTLGLVNQGTISAQTPGQTLTVTGSNWTNTGTLGATNGGTLKLAGTFTTAGLGTFTTGTGGAIVVAGTLDNTGAVIALAPNAALGIGGGTIKGGSITSTGGTPFTAYPGQSFLATVDVGAPVVLLPGSNLGFSGTNRGGITGNGAIVLQGAWSNPGSIAVGAGGAVTIAPTGSMPSDFGFIALTDATLYTSTVLTTARFNTITRSNSLAVIQSQLTNTGDILTITPATGNVRLSGGSIVGGTVVTTGAAALEANTSACTLDGVTLQGNLTMLNGGIVAVTNAGLMPVDAHVSLAATTNTTSLNFLFDQTFSGTADVTFDGNTPAGNPPLNSVAPVGSGSEKLTLGPGITVRTRTNSGRVGGSSASFGTLVNNGTVSAQAPGRDLFAQGYSVTNNATFGARDGGSLVVNATQFVNSGTVTVGPGSTLKISAGTLNNTGRIDLAGGRAIVDYTGTSMATTVRAQLASGRAGGS